VVRVRDVSAELSMVTEAVRLAFEYHTRSYGTDIRLLPPGCPQYSAILKVEHLPV